MLIEIKSQLKRPNLNGQRCALALKQNQRKALSPGGGSLRQIDNDLPVKVLGVTLGVALGPEVSPETTSNNVKCNG